jgi:phosphoglycerate dehydrogenase-like enzyme
MAIFTVLFSGDYLNERGQIAYKGVDLGPLVRLSYVRVGFMGEQMPVANDPGYWERLYSLEVGPQHVAAANGLIILRPWVKASAFAQGAGNLVAIGRAGAGYDKIDLAACTANDVVVLNAPDTLTHATASAAFLFMQMLARRVPEHERILRAGRWDLQPQIMGDDLIGQTLGIVGLGNTGRELARLVAPFQMRVLAYSPHADAAQAAALGVTLVPTLDELLCEADFVSLHCRLTEGTRRLIGERELRLLKPKAYFINVARGELVDTEALVRCLRERWIRGAALDVFDIEPLPLTHPLLELDNVILTPHWLPSTRQAVRDTAEEIACGMLRVARGQVPEHVVNPEVLARPGFRAKLARFAENAE